MSNTPSNAEAWDLWIESITGGHHPASLAKFACAVLAKWGSPQPATLGFTIENRAGADVVVWKEGGCRPATSAEIAMWKALSAAQQPVVREPSEAEIVFAAISSGEWAVTRNQPISYLTDEGNARNAWSVQRAVAPYCADIGQGKDWGNRVWNGPTALTALKAAAKEIGIPLPIAQKGGSDGL